MSWKIIGSFLGGIATAAPLLWFFVMEAYQKKRVTQFLDPESDPLGAGYQIIQSLIAIGSGGNQRQRMDQCNARASGLSSRKVILTLSFSTYAEEWGFIGSLILLGLYLFITGRVIWLACQCESPFNRLVSGALSLSFFLYAFINMGMVSGVLPVMGSPLPFFSYGGTAMITQGVCFGIIMSLCLYKPYKGK